MGKHDLSTVDLNQDVQIIRDILFGEQLNNLVKRLEELEKANDRLKQQNMALKEALDTEIQSRLNVSESDEVRWANFRNEILAELEALKDTISGQLAQETETYKANLTRQNDRLSRRIRQVRSDVNGHRDQLDNLISSLAKALVSLRQADEPVDDEADGR